MYIANRVGPRILPCGIPLVTLDLFEHDVPIFTHCYRLDKKQEIHLFNLLAMPEEYNFTANLLCETDQRLFRVKINNVIWIAVIKHITQIFNNMQQLSDTTSVFTKTMLTITM